jgi:threonine dehydratase
MTQQTDTLVGLEEIRDAARRLEGVVRRTPLLATDTLSDEVGGEVRLKCESFQRAGSFKIRGAYNFVAQIPDEERSHGVITYSSGNHAQAVALAARSVGIRAVVVMPVDAPPIKVEGARRLGAEVIFEGTTSVERKHRAEAIQADRGLTMVPPFDDPRIIAGQGTVGLEIVQDWPEVDTYFVCIGGGGLASGSAAALRGMKPEAKIYGVEPAGAASMDAALRAGEPVTLPSVDTIADGLKPVRAGDLTFRHVRHLVDDVLLVSDAEILSAASLLLHTAKFVVEFSGAAAVAAARSGRVPLHGRHTAVVISGGNLDPSLFARLVKT